MLGMAIGWMGGVGNPLVSEGVGLPMPSPCHPIQPSTEAPHHCPHKLSPPTPPRQSTSCISKHFKPNPIRPNPEHP